MDRLSQIVRARLGELLRQGERRSFSAAREPSTRCRRFANWAGSPPGFHLDSRPGAPLVTQGGASFLRSPRRKLESSHKVFGAGQAAAGITSGTNPPSQDLLKARCDVRRSGA